MQGPVRATDGYSIIDASISLYALPLSIRRWGGGWGVGPVRSHILHQTDQCQDAAVEDMCRWVNGDLLEEDAIVANRRGDTAIQNVAGEGASGTRGGDAESVVAGNLPGAYQQ